MRKRMLENERKQYENFEKNYKESIFYNETSPSTSVQSIPVKEEFAMIEVEEEGFFKKLWAKFTSLFTDK